MFTTNSPTHVTRVLSYFSSKATVHFSEWLNREHIEIEPVDKDAMSPRVLSHWEKMGLIPLGAKRAERSWRRFNLIELLWVILIMEMRAVGMPLGQIKKVKDSLTSREELNKHISALPEEFQERYKLTTNPFLEAAIYFMWFEKEQVFLVCPFKGAALPLSVGEFNLRMNLEEIKSSTSIYLNPILQSIFPKKDLAPKKIELGQMRDDIIRLLGLIYDTKATNLEVTMKDGRISRVNLTHNENIEANIFKLLNKADYQDITLSSEGGRTQTIKRVEKIKF